ncbi:LysR family transcriptional regulator [Sphingomonas flavalba]|uniref:LysR family transcriptional regulator n=1 Tax=Sphingomonas flavalba TaxID=2559804 RepID=UPI0039E07C28
MSDIALMYFFEAATLGSMRLASDKIGVAVSSISRQIAQLEQTLGVPLIERSRRSIKLTTAGELAYQYYRSARADREAFQARLRELRDIKTGIVHLAVGEGFLGGPFVSIIDSFQRANPGIEIVINSAGTADMLRMVVEDEVHIALVFHSIDEPKIRVRASALQPLMVICAPGHPLAALDRVTLRDLADHRLCLPPKGFRIRQTLSAAEASEHIWLQPRLTTDSLHVMCATAMLGDAVTILPPISAMAEIEQGLLVSRPLVAEDLDHTTISLIHRLGRQLDGAPSRLLAILEAKLRSWAVPPA